MKVLIKMKKLSDKHKDSLRKAWIKRKEKGMGIPWNKGKKTGSLSDKTKQKLSKALLGNKNGKGFKKGCRNYAILGKNHPNWKGGKSRRKHGNIRYRRWRSKVFERDNWTCQTCGNKGVYIEPHHIKSWSKYPKLRYCVDNGVTLCLDCHKMTENYKGKQR